MIVIDVNREIYQNKSLSIFPKLIRSYLYIFGIIRHFPRKKSISFGKLFDPVSFYLNASLIWFLVHFSHFDFSRGVAMSSKT